MMRNLALAETDISVGGDDEEDECALHFSGASFNHPGTRPFTLPRALDGRDKPSPSRTAVQALQQPGHVLPQCCHGSPGLFVFFNITWIAPKEKAGLYMGANFLAVGIGGFTSGVTYTTLSVYFADKGNPGHVWYVLAAHLILAIAVMMIFRRLAGDFTEQEA